MTFNFLSAERKAEILAESLPFIQSFHGKTFVIYCAGDLLSQAELLAEFGSDIALLQQVGIRPVVVHGGQRQITEQLDKMGVYSIFRHGYRVTDATIMNSVAMVLGQLNREIVEAINRQGGRAVGLDGFDNHFIHAQKLLLPSEGEVREWIVLGQVGEVERIDVELIHSHQSHNFIPVVMPIGVGADGQAYNINADEVAAKLAEALSAEKLIVLSNLPGAIDQNGKLISGLTVSEMRGLADSGLLRNETFVKIEAALDAVKHGVKSAHVIDGRVPNALLLEVFTSEGVGTMVRSDAGAHFFSDSLRYLQAKMGGNFDGALITFDESKQTHT